MKPLYAIDLFCGAGGMSEGILQAGFDILFSSDLSEDVEKTYTHRHEQLGIHQGIHTHFQRGDIRELTGKFILEKIAGLKRFQNQPIPSIDAIFGGPPCQGFSMAGKRKQNDPRNMLFKEYVRIIHEVQPGYVVMENVKGFLTTSLDGFIGLDGSIYPDKTPVKEIVISEFEKIGYQTLPIQVLDTSQYGVPQKRERVILIAYQKGQVTPSYPLPLPSKKVTILEALWDLMEPVHQKQLLHPVDTSYAEQAQKGRTQLLSDGSVQNHERPNHAPIIEERFSLYQMGESRSAAFKRIERYGINLKHYPHLWNYCSESLQCSKEEVLSLYQTVPLDKHLVDTLLTKKNSRTKLHIAQPSPTMMSQGDEFIHPFENRGLTVREMARLQSFDDSFVFQGKRATGGLRRRIDVPQYTQVGNAVPPLLARAVALEIKKALLQER